MKQITKDLIRVATTVHPGACSLTKEMHIRLRDGSTVTARAAKTIKGGLHIHDGYSPAVFHLVDEDDIVGVTIHMDKKAEAAGVKSVPELIAWAEKQARAAA